MNFTLTPFDLFIFIAFLVIVITLGMWKGRKENDSRDYFLAGRALPWWLIGISLIAANISTEQFVGMNGSAAGPTGLAIASYCWIASIGLVIVAFTFLPAFLKTGVYTVPEFLEYRYHAFARTVMAVVTVFVYVFVNIAAVIYSGAVVLTTLFHGQLLCGMPITLENSCWILGFIACVYVVAGGLKACAWADFLQGSALILGGLIITFLAFASLEEAPITSLAPTTTWTAAADSLETASAFGRFFTLNEDKLHMFLPGDDRVLPWTALVIGLWIPNFYYWGLNQYIVQRTLGAKSLKEGQKGVVLAASIHVITPLFVVVAGLLAFNLFSVDMARSAIDDKAIQAANTRVLEQYERQKEADLPTIFFNMDDGWRSHNMKLASEIDLYNRSVPESPNVSRQMLIGYKYDTAFALLIQKLVPTGIRGFILAAILGAIVSSLGAMLNSASSIFTMDIFRKFIVRNASEKSLVLVGRMSVVMCMVISCWIAPKLANPQFGGIFHFMQEFQGFISPGILAAFVFGLLFKKAPPVAGIAALITNPVLYGLLLVFAPHIAFLNRMAVTFVAVFLVMGIFTLVKPLPEPRVMPQNKEIDLTSSRGALFAGLAVIVVIVLIYIVFR